MSEIIEAIEKQITAYWSTFFKIIFCFLDKEYQSLCVSIIHYLIFIVGLYMFFFIYKPGSIYRFTFFIFVLLATIAYFLFDKCILTSIELGICCTKNKVQQIIGDCIGHKIEGNISSKIVLTSMTLFTGLTLLKDYLSEKNNTYSIDETDAEK